MLLVVLVSLKGEEAETQLDDGSYNEKDPEVSSMMKHTIR